MCYRIKNRNDMLNFLRSNNHVLNVRTSILKACHIINDQNNFNEEYSEFDDSDESILSNNYKVYKSTELAAALVYAVRLQKGRIKNIDDNAEAGNQILIHYLLDMSAKYFNPKRRFTLFENNDTNHLFLRTVVECKKYVPEMINRINLKNRDQFYDYFIKEVHYENRDSSYWVEACSEMDLLFDDNLSSKSNLLDFRVQEAIKSVKNDL